MRLHECCRVCGGDFHRPALLEFPAAPAFAQGFADTAGRGDDVVDLAIYQCSCCGLVQHDLPPVTYYRDVIRAIAFSEEMRRFRVVQLSEWVARHGLRDKRVLEVGCGRGEYLELLQAAGLEGVCGLEHSADSVAHARQRGFEVHQGYLAPGFTDPWKERFDAFAIFSFMEHWPDLSASLRSLRGALTADAIGLIEVPNFEFIVESGLYSEFTVDHIFYFDRDTLRGVLECNGFQVLSVEPVWRDYILSAQVRRRTPIDSTAFVAKQSRIVRELQDYAARFDRDDVAVWGAGHQALAVMSMAGLQDRVSHVLDSAPFKQNKFAPGTGLPIRAPETLRQDQVRAVIVMAAAYSDEVVRTIRSSYPHIGNIAVLREDGVEVINDGD